MKPEGNVSIRHAARTADAPMSALGRVSPRHKPPLHELASHAPRHAAASVSAEVGQERAFHRVRENWNNLAEIQRSASRPVDTATQAMKTNTFPVQSAPLLTTGEAAQTFNVTERTIRSWIKQDILQAVKIGGVVRISRERVQQLIEGTK
jgi:excisionase family DNA binding protein